MKKKQKFTGCVNFYFITYNDTQIYSGFNLIYTKKNNKRDERTHKKFQRVQ